MNKLYIHMFYINSINNLRYECTNLIIKKSDVKNTSVFYLVYEVVNHFMLTN